jgi:hypothetical protein
MLWFVNCAFATEPSLPLQPEISKLGNFYRTMSQQFAPFECAFDFSDIKTEYQLHRLQETLAFCVISRVFAKYPEQENLFNQVMAHLPRKFTSFDRFPILVQYIFYELQNDKVKSTQILNRFPVAFSTSFSQQFRNIVREIQIIKTNYLEDMKKSKNITRRENIPKESKVKREIIFHSSTEEYNCTCLYFLFSFQTDD